MNKKKKFIITAVVIIFVVSITLFAGVKLSKSKSKPVELKSLSLSTAVDSSKNPVTLVAHRGFSGKAPENTLAAVRAAGEAGFDACEFDIRLTSEGFWVVSHDNDIRRMTDGKGKISDKSLAGLSQYTIDNGSNIADYPNEKIPTFEEMLDACTANNIAPVIEIKLEENQNPDYKNLAAIIQSKGYEDAVIISFHMNALTSLREYLPDAEYWFLATTITDDTIAECVANKIDGLDFNGNKQENLDYIKKAADAGLVLSAWTIDSIDTLDELYNRGVYVFTTNAIHP